MSTNLLLHQQIVLSGKLYCVFQKRGLLYWDEDGFFSFKCVEEMNIDIFQYLTSLREQLLADTNWQSVALDPNWVKKAPKMAGVYVFRENNELIYVGETGNMRGRMNELRNSRQHTLRRSLGKRLYGHIDGFVMATDRENFPKPIELLLIDYINANLQVAYLPVDLGRKELEELIDSELKPEFRLNKRGKRKT